MQRPNEKPVIYVVATPIGNLADMTDRARQVLSDVDLIAAEDTRETRKLLSHFQINGKQLISYQDHGEAERAASIMERIIKENLSLALVSDAGTPAISDPGFRLIALAREHEVPVHPVPGASAMTALVSASGLPSDRILFIGFLPVKEAAVKQEMQTWIDTRASVVFYESTRRLNQVIKIMAETLPFAKVCIGRELTKVYEEIHTFSINEALVWCSAHDSLKGEAVVMVDLSGMRKNNGGFVKVDLARLKEDARKEFKHGSSLKDLLQKYKDCGLSRSALYQLLLEAKPSE